MREIKKIIWATDDSKESEKALNYALFFAQRFDSQIIGIHVIPMPEATIYHFLSHSTVELKRWTEKIEEAYKAKFASISDDLNTHEIIFRGEILKGEPNKEIIEFAQSEKADLIVMGKRGHGLIDRTLIGSTTIKVLRESSEPVLAVGEKDKEGIIEMRNILVPIEAYEKTDSALNYAIDLAQRINANITVVYVPYIYNYEGDYNRAYTEDLMMHYSTHLERRVKDIKVKRGIDDGGSSNLEIKTEVIGGLSSPVSIVDYASSKKMDLIVMNTHGKKGIKRAILGSVTEKVLQESPCAVLALRP